VASAYNFNRAFDVEGGRIDSLVVAKPFLIGIGPSQLAHPTPMSWPVTPGIRVCACNVFS